METTEAKQQKPSIITPKLNQPKITKDVGALWGKTEDNGDEYFTGEITLNSGVKTMIYVRRNNYKTEDKHPDWRIYLAPTRQKETV